MDDERQSEASTPSWFRLTAIAVSSVLLTVLAVVPLSVLAVALAAKLFPHWSWLYWPLELIDLGEADPVGLLPLAAVLVGFQCALPVLLALGVGLWIARRRQR